MTSFREPDYDLALELLPGGFKKITGFTFACRIIFGDRRGRFGGMLAVPEGGSSNRAGREAWLWADNNISSPVGTCVHIMIEDPCDPLFFHLFEELAAHKGLRLEGLITRVRAVNCDGHF